VAEEREVVARLNVEKTGEVGAFREGAEEVRELKQEAEGAAPAIEQVGDASAESAEQVGDLGRSAGGAVDTLANVASKAVAVAAAFKAGWEAGKLLREGLNWITDGGFDEGVQGLLTKVLGLEEGLDSSADAAQRMANAQRILKANGIDPTGLSLAELDKKLEEVSRKKYDAAKAAETLAKADEAWAAKMGISQKALDESASKLAGFIERFKAANEQLSDQDLAAIFGEQIQEILDAYDTLKRDVPPAIADIAKAWNVSSSAVEKEAERQKRAVDGMVKEILGSTKELAGDLKTQGEAIGKALEKIDFGSLNPEQLERAKSILQQFVEESRAAGKQIPQDIADEAASMGILVAAMEVAGEGSSSLSGDQQELAGAVGGVARTVKDGATTLTNLGTAAKEAGGEVRSAGGQIAEGGTAAGEGAQSIQSVKQAILDLTATAKQAGQQTKDAGGEIKEGAEKAGEAAESLAAAGEAGTEAGTGLGAAKDAAQGLGDAAKSGASGVDELQEKLRGLGEGAQGAVAALQAINELDLSQAKGEVDSLSAALDGLIAKAAAAQAALAAIDSDAGAVG